MRGYRFDDVEIDLDRRQVRHAGTEVPVDRQVFDVIVHLAANSHRVVTRTELLDEVWGDRFVSDSALSTQIKHARRALGDDGRRQSRIATVRGVGYRLIVDPAPTDADDDSGTGTDDDHAAIGRGSLPEPFEELIGREQELATIERLVGSGMAVTLVGPGGVGKTRLATEAARRLRDRFVDGARLVELASVTGDDDVTAAAADAIGVQAGPGESLLTALCRAIAGRRLLLVIDNCEHLPDGVLALTTALARSCPTVTILATSRTPLGFDGEHLVAVPPLTTRLTPSDRSLPAADALLVRRLRAAGIDDPDRELVASICHRLDGIPLAIELAAGRARTLGLAELNDRLDRAIELLEARRPNERHRTLRDTIGWSYDLLPSRHRRLLQRVSVFAAPFTVAAAEHVALDEQLTSGDVISGLAALADASLLQPILDAAGGRRFRMLQTIRQFARETADPDDLACTTARFIAFQVESVRSGTEEWLGSEPERWATLAHIELDNTREAARRAIHSGDVDAAIELATQMFFGFGLDRNDDSIQWADAVLDIIGPEHPLHLRTLIVASTRATQLAGDRDEMIARVEAALGSAGTETTDPMVANQLGLLHWFNGDAETAIVHHRRAVELYEAQGEPVKAGIARGGISMAADALDRDEALRQAHLVLETADRFDSAILRAHGLLCLGGTQAHGDPEAAFDTVSELVDIGRRVGSRFHLGSGLRVRAHLLSRLRRFDAADACYIEALEVNGIGDKGMFLWYTVLNLIEHFIRCGRLEVAALALTAYERSPAAIRDDLVERSLARSRATLIEALGEARLEAHEQQAAEITQAAFLSRLVDELGRP